MWVAALLAVLLGQHRLFEGDWADGSLEQWLLAPRRCPAGAGQGGGALVAGRALVAGGAAAGLAVRLDGAVIAVLLASLALGTPSLYLLAALGAALTLGLRGQLLLVLVVLPLSIPS
jgi:heme exporter protein B